MMVDDVLAISKCGPTSIAMNALVNSFLSSKKLKLNKTKCAKIDVGRKSDSCPSLFMQYKKIKDSEQEKYLGEVIHQKGTATVVDHNSTD